MTSSDLSDRWFCKTGTSKIGPLSTEQLRAMVDTGALTTESQLWREGMDSWLPAGEVLSTLPPSSAPIAPSRHRALIPALAMGAGCVVLAVVLLRSPRASRLLTDALHAQDKSAQLRATQGLLKLGPEALRETKTVVSESTNLEVTALAIAGLAEHRDYSSIELIFAKLDDPSSIVRASAARAVARLLGRDYHFPVEGSLSERAKSKDTIVADWKALKGSELFRRNVERLQANTEGLP